MSLSVSVWKAPSENLIIENYQPVASHHTSNDENSKSRNCLIESETELPLSDSLVRHHPQITVEMEQQKFLADLLHLQTASNHPAMKGLIEYVLKMKCELAETKIKNAELEHFIAKHSDALFQDIAQDLFEKIKSSPRLKKKLEQLKLDDESLEFHSLIDQLESSSQTAKSKSTLKDLSQDWTWIEPNKASIVVDVDITGLDELQYQINLLETAGRSAGNPQQFFLEMDRVRQATQTKPRFHLGRTLYNAGTMTWQVIQGVTSMVSFMRSAAPTVLFVAPRILPVPWIREIQFVLRVFL